MLLFAACAPATSSARSPIIDMHLHAWDLGVKPGEDARRDFTEWPDAYGLSRLGIPAPPSTAALERETLAAMDRHNIVRAVVSGPHSERYRSARPDRVLASPFLIDPSGTVESLRAAFSAGRYQALAELAPQYAGIAPNDPLLEPYYALAEELDVPVGIHVGLGPPGAAYTTAPGHSPSYRMAHSNPLLLEDALVRHPKLRLYVMHAGWPMLDEMVGLLYAHPQVYVELGVIDWALPRAEFHSYLRRLVEAGFSKRIMFGSDQMNWPGVIGVAIDAIESAPFLTEDQRRDILCRNAARFLRISPATCE